MSATTNGEGLTFREWLAAAGWTLLEMFGTMNSHAFEEAWRNGEDPSEWRAAKERNKQG